MPFDYSSKYEWLCNGNLSDGLFASIHIALIAFFFAQIV